MAAAHDVPCQNQEIERRELEEAIASYQELLGDSETSEAQFQSFFENHLAAFQGLGFEESFPQPRFVDSTDRLLIPDFILRTSNGSLHVLDLKTMKPQLIRGSDHREVFRAEVQDGIAQLHHYAEYFDDKANREYLSEALGVPVAPQPDLHLAIGRTSLDVSREVLHQMERRHARRLTIHTFDDILVEMRSFHRRTFGHGEGLPGASAHFVLRLHEQDRSEPRVVWEAGNDSAGRWVVAIGSGNAIILSVTTAAGETTSLHVPGSIAQVENGFKVMLSCQAGSTAGYSILEVAVDGHIRGTLEFPHELPLPSVSGLPGGATIGAAKGGKMGMAMDLFAIAVFDRVLGLADRLQLLEELDKGADQPDLGQ